LYATSLGTFPIGIGPYLQQFAAKPIQFRLVVVLFGLGERVFCLPSLKAESICKSIED
jgi:hypothetical protein